MKMIRNMAFYFDGKFYATQGGPMRAGYSVSEAKLPADWDTKVETNYPVRISKDTIQFTLIDSDACGITGSLSDFNPDNGSAMCAGVLRLFTVIGDETSGLACDATGANIGTLCCRECLAYVVTAAPSSITVEGERVETLTVTFRTTTPFTSLSSVPKLTIPVYHDPVPASATYACGGATRAAGDYEFDIGYGDALPEITTTNIPEGTLAGHTFVGLADCAGKLYYTPPVAPATTKYVAALTKFDRLLPIALYYKFEDA